MQRPKDTPSISDRAIAAMLGVSHHTVKNEREVLEQRGQIAHTEQRTDTTGRKQPAKKPIRTAFIDDTPEGYSGTFGNSERRLGEMIVAQKETVGLTNF